MSTVKRQEHFSEALFWYLCLHWTSSSTFRYVWTFFSCLTRKIFLSVGFEDILGKFEENNILAESSKAPKDSFSLLGEIDDNSPNPQTGNHHGLANDRQREKCPNTEFFLVRIFPHLNWIRRDTFQSECGEMRTRKNSVSGHFSCSER